ncbi:MAG: hypothetical protein HKN33_16970 [Pyrinomonadaceae bacterium]|nr:hypothetical protein [Pyrinomonadaceae bacterium]
MDVTDSNRDAATQRGLFDPASDVKAEDVVMYALGDFQDRGFELAGRELALDRLLGALSRAYMAFDIVPLNDEAVAGILQRLEAKVEELPQFVAKHPFRVTVPKDLAEKSLRYFSTFKEKR